MKGSDNMTDEVSIIPRIREIRRSQNISQTHLAGLIGVSQSTMSAYEHGTYLPDVRVLAQIGRIFDVSLDYLVGLSDVRCPYGEGTDLFFKKYNSLNPKKRALLTSYIEVLSEE